MSDIGETRSVRQLQKFAFLKSHLWDMRNNIILVSLIVILTGCKVSGDRIVETESIVPYKTVSEISDSVFFRNIHHFLFYNETFYLLDLDLARILICDKNLKLSKVIGQKGAGPGELLYPSDIVLTPENLIAVKDYNTISFFNHGGDLIRRVKFEEPLANLGFIVQKDNSILISTKYSDSPITHFDSTGKVINKFGIEFEIEKYDLSRDRINGRALFKKGEDRIVTVGEVMPIIEIYSNEGDLILSKTILDDQITYKAQQAYEKMSLEKNISVLFYNDVCLYDNKVFILKSISGQKENGEYSNKQIIYIIDLTEKDVSIDRILELNMPENDRWYIASFCVVDNKNLVTFDYISGGFSFYRY
jgi:hypothetical protein